MLRTYRIAALALLCCLIASTGCRLPYQQHQFIRNPAPAPEVPAADLPVQMRPYNWTDAGGSGSCVNASTVYMLRWRNMEELADWWRKNHAGGETETSIRSHHDAVGLKYAYTRSADASFLDWCSRTRRGAIIWFYQSHCVTFCGFGREPGDTTEYAYINDNNRPQKFIKIERREFLERWRGYGGFALSILDPPVPSRLYPAYTEAH